MARHPWGIYSTPKSRRRSGRKSATHGKSGLVDPKYSKAPGQCSMQLVGGYYRKTWYYGRDPVTGKRKRMPL